MLNRDSAIRIFGIAIILSSLVNGAFFYAARIGAIKRDKAEKMWAYTCGVAGTTSRPFGLGKRCVEGSRRAAMAGAGAEPYLYLYESRGAEILLKFAKDFVIAAILLFGLVSAVRTRAIYPGWREHWPQILFLLLTVVHFCFSLAQNDVAGGLAGLRSLSFIGIGLFGFSLARAGQLSSLGSMLVVLLSIQIPLVLIEALYGLPVHGYLGFLNLPKRMCGTFVQPNSLAAFAVVALAFYDAFSEDRRFLKPFFTIAFLLILVSGSGTGLYSFLLVSCWILLRVLKPGKRYIVLTAALVLIAALTILLPTITRRPIFASLNERVAQLYLLAQRSSTKEILIGRGLGTGTNAAISRANLQTGTENQEWKPADSMVILLMRQMGIVGSILFYIVLLHAAFARQHTRLFFAVVFLTSLTINLTELFPVNVLLGLVLASPIYRTTDR